MNRYTAAGVLADIRDGRRVLVLSETQHLARCAFAEVTAGAQDGERVRRTNGDERITAEDGRGWVAFGSNCLRLRGFTVDVVVFDAHKPSPDELASVGLNIAGSPDSEVIRP